MGRSVLKVKGYRPEDIKALIKKNKDYKIGIKLNAVWQVSRGKTSRELASVYPVSFKQILNWVHWFEQEGVAGLADKPRRGRKSRLSEGQREELAVVLAEKRPEDFGYNSATWTGPLLRDWIKSEFGVEYKQAQIYNIIKSLGFTYQKGKGLMPEADPEKKRTFKKDLKKTLGISR
jgi:transposase